MLVWRQMMRTRSLWLHDFTSGFAIMVMIIGTGRFELQARNLPIIHNWLRWGELYIMNVREKWEAKLQADISVVVAGNFWSEIGNLGLHMAPEGYSPWDCSKMTWDYEASKIEEFLIWKLTLVRSEVIPRRRGVAKAYGRIRSCGRPSGRLLVAWTCVTNLMRVNYRSSYIVN